MRITVLLVAVLLSFSSMAGENWNNAPARANPLHKSFTSASMKCEVGYNISLPPDYEKNPQQRYPVIYYLHGRGGTENDNMGGFGQLEGAIKEGKIPPVIYVHAMAGRNSGYVDAPDGSVMGETVVIKELIPHIDATYRTIARREGRGIEGFSKGGQGALLFAFKFPEMFCAVNGYAAGLANGVELKKELPAVFKQMHGDSIEQFDSSSAWHFARANADKIRGQVAIRIVLGDKDQHLKRNRNMHKLLEELNIPHEYKELPGIGHDTGRVYKDVGVEGFVFLAKHFKQ